MTSPQIRRLAIAGALAGVAALAIACGNGSSGSVGSGSGGSGGSGSDPDEPPPFPTVLNLQEAEGGSVGLAKGEGNAVTLTAQPDEGYAFTGWECPSRARCPRDADGSRMAEITVAVTRDLTLAPVFTRQVTLRLESAADGRATADCEPDCELDAGTQVMLRAIAEPGFRFRYWECDGAATCSSFDRSNPTASVRLTEDSTLTALFEPQPEVTLAVQDGPGGTIVLDAQCGEGCGADGSGWRAVVRAVPDGGHLFSGWRCVGAGSCPSEVENERGATLEFVPRQSLVITADFEESNFSIVSEDSYDFSLTTRSVEQQAACSGQNECVFLVGGTSVNLTVQGDVEGLRGHGWRLSEGASHLRLGNQRGSSVTVQGSNDISEIMVSTVEATALNADGTQELRDTLTVVAIPPALAVQVGFGCSGSVVFLEGQHYVITAGHCLLMYDVGENNSINGRVLREEPIDVKILTGGDGLSLGGTIVGVDEIADLGLLRISDPDLAWVPSIGALEARAEGQVVRTVGTPVSRDLVIVDDFEPVVTEGMVLRQWERCPLFPEGPDAAIGLFTECEVPVFVVSPDFAGAGSSGGPVINEAYEVVGVVTGGLGGITAFEDTPVTQSADLEGGEALQPLLQGGFRCEVFEERMDDELGGIVRTTVGVDDCTGSEQEGGP